jgi:hypothetical protein
MHNLLTQTIQALSDARRYGAGDWTQLETKLEALRDNTWAVAESIQVPLPEQWTVHTTGAGSPVCLIRENDPNDECLRMSGDYESFEERLAYAQDLALRLSAPRVTVKLE